MRKRRKVFALLIVMCVLLGGLSGAYAKYVDSMVKIYIPIYQIKQYITAERSSAYSYVYMKNYSVEPTDVSITDTYQYIWGGVADSSGNSIINSDVKLKEGDPATRVSIKEGKLNVENIKYYFYGNDPSKNAYAYIGYSAPY